MPPKAVDVWQPRPCGGWASEASLFDLVRARFPDAVAQWSASWLGRQRVDVFVPSINVAFEYQGEQHYRPVQYFGGEKAFHGTVSRDAQKRERLIRRGIILIEWPFHTPVVAMELERALRNAGVDAGKE